MFTMLTLKLLKMDERNNIVAIDIIEMLMDYPENVVSSDSESSSICSLSDSDEEEDKTKRRKLVRIHKYSENVISKYSEEEFKSHFRLTRATSIQLIELIKKSIFLPKHLDGREKIPAEKSILISLWYFGNQETFRQMSDRFDVTLSSVHRTIRRVVKFLLAIKYQIIKWPTSEKVETIKNGFFIKKGIQHVVGAIDGSHIEILKPNVDGESYINRKGYASLLLQGVVDHEKKFIVFCGEPGSLHDARLLRKSALFAKMHSTPHFMGNNMLLGDSAYPNLHWLVTPYKDNGNLTRQQKEFNYRHSATRVVVENAFGLLKGRFRRLRHLDNLDIQLCSEIIMAACVLHNICIDQKDLIDCDPVDFNQPEEIEFNKLQNINISNNSTRQQVFDELYGSEKT